MAGTVVASVGTRDMVLSGMGLPPAGRAFSASVGGGPLRATVGTASLGAALHHHRAYQLCLPLAPMLSMWYEGARDASDCESLSI